MGLGVGVGVAVVVVVVWTSMWLIAWHESAPAIEFVELRTTWTVDVPMPVTV